MVADEGVDAGLGPAGQEGWTRARSSPSPGLQPGLQKPGTEKRWKCPQRSQEY